MDFWLRSVDSRNLKRVEGPDGVGLRWPSSIRLIQFLLAAFLSSLSLCRFRIFHARSALNFNNGTSVVSEGNNGLSLSLFSLIWRTGLENGLGSVSMVDVSFGRPWIGKFSDWVFSLDCVVFSFGLVEFLEDSLGLSSHSLARDAASTFILLSTWSLTQTYTSINAPVTVYLEIALAASVVRSWKGEVYSQHGIIFSKFDADFKAIHGVICFVLESVSQCISFESDAEARLQSIQSPSTYCSSKSMSILEDFRSMARSHSQIFFHGIRKTAYKSTVWNAIAFSIYFLSLIGVCYSSLVVYLSLFVCNDFGILLQQEGINFLLVD